MNDLTHITTPSGEIQTLLDLCQNTRYGALLLDEETQEATLHTQLLSSEIDELTSERTTPLKASVQAFVEGHPCLVLEARAHEHDFQWVLPLWQFLARQWLQAVQRQGQFQVLLQGSDKPACLTVMRMRVPEGDIARLFELDTKDKDADWQTSTDAMLVSGFRALVEQHADPQRANRLRLAVACDPVRADALQQTYQMGSGLVNRLFQGMATQTKH